MVEFAYNPVVDQVVDLLADDALVADFLDGDYGVAYSLDIHHPNHMVVDDHSHNHNCNDGDGRTSHHHTKHNPTTLQRQTMRIV
jgi:hypothetical protein